MLNKHVHHLLTGYVHRQLPRAQRARVMQHIAGCAECRAALAREEQLVRDVQAYLPAIGKPAPGQMARIRAKVLAEANTPAEKAQTPFWFPSFGVAVMAILLCGFVLSAFFSGATSVTAASLQPVLAEVEATWTPIVTERPGLDLLAVTDATERPRASQTVPAYFAPPAASPVPPPR